MTDRIQGIHHVTAIAGDPQGNVDFYAGLLGLRLIKQTVNFDDPGTYHLYFGDDLGRPGTAMTFFPWPGGRRGSRGAGQATLTAFSVPEGSLELWQRRLRDAGIPFEEPKERFGERVLPFADPDGLRLELVERGDLGDLRWWSEGGVPAEAAIRGFDGVTLLLRDAGPSRELLTGVLGFLPGDSEGSRERLTAAATQGPGSRVDLVAAPDAAWGQTAVGTVHHVAWRAADEREQAEWSRALGEVGQRVTPVRDRQYFRSIYFREPGGVLFEIATDGPGFTTDEEPAELGSALRLPPWLEESRSQIEARLPELRRPETAMAAAGGER